MINQATALAMPVGRLFISLVFILSGVTKAGSYSGTAAWMDSVGVPGTLLPLVIILEILGGMAIVIGWKVRPVSILFAGFCVLSAVLFHADFSNQAEIIQFLKNVALAGGFLFLFAGGAGAYSLDERKS